MEIKEVKKKSHGLKFTQRKKDILDKEKWIMNGLEDLKEIEHLPDDERWMIVSEGRPSEMIWFICYPKTKR